MENKIIFGVAHDPNDQKEIKRAKRKIFRYKPSSLGLELPANYREWEEKGIRTFFFSDLASYAISHQIEVVALEDPALADYHLTLEVVKVVREGKVNEEDLHQELQELKSNFFFSSPEISAGPRRFEKRYARAIEILKNNSSLDEVLKSWDESNKNREVYMLDRIRFTLPKMIILGGAHSERLVGKLEEYTYGGFI